MRIVLLQPSLLGDVIVSTPLMRHLRQSIPDLRLTVVLGQLNLAIRPLLGNLVDDVLEFRKRPMPLLKLMLRARKTRYDYLLDGAWDPLRSSPALVHMIGARQSIGLPNGWKNLYDIIAPGPPRGQMNYADRYLSLAGPLKLGPPRDPRVELFIPPVSAQWAEANWKLDRARPTVLVNITGTGAHKFWGVEKFIGLIREVGARHPELGFGVAGHPRDRQSLDRIAQETGAAVLATSSNFAHFAAQIRLADYVFTPDTSVIHLAAAWQKPVVGLYVRRPIQDKWDPYQTPHVRLQSPTETVHEISLEQGIEGFEQLLAKVAPSASAGANQP
jgi:ADP-heptose:LPS heptosyltransferase